MPVEDLSKIFFEGYFASIWDEGGMQTQNKVKQLFSDGISCFIIPIKILVSSFPKVVSVVRGGLTAIDFNKYQLVACCFIN